MDPSGGYASEFQHFSRKICEGLLSLHLEGAFQKEEEEWRDD